MTSHNGVLYIASTTTGRLHTVNLPAGTTTQLPSVLGISDPRAMTSHNGVLYIADANTGRLYTINLPAGTTTQLPSALGINNPRAMTSHGVGGTFRGISERISLQRTSDTELQIFPAMDGYLFEALAVA